MLVEYAAPLLRAGRRPGRVEGRAATQREEADGDAAAAATRARGREVRAGRGRGRGRHRHLHVYLKVGSTPKRFPRRPGMARKRPLRASA